MSGSQKRISIALLFAAVLISVALFLRADTPTSAENREAAVAVVAPERQALPELDQNNDGVPDWQEALQITEPLEITGEPTDGYTPPDTLTEQFALDFFQDIVRSENYGAFGTSPDELVANAANALAEEVTDTLYVPKDVIIGDNNSPEALTAYGEAIAAIMTSYSEDSAQSEADIFMQALRSQNEEDLTKLDGKILAYTNYVEKTKALTVPSSMVREHLDLLNSYQAIQSDIAAMRDSFSDPMLALLRMKRYQDDATGLLLAINNLYTALVNQNITWDSDSIVYSVISINDNN